MVCLAGLIAVLDEEAVARLDLDDLWLHPEVSGAWAWANGDKMIATWFRERGRSLPWSSLFVHQWDMLVAVPAEKFDICGTDQVLLPGVRPLTEVEDHWVWVQGWSDYFDEFMAFQTHELVLDKPLFAMVFILAVLGRGILAKYAEVVEFFPGLIEYRLPTVLSLLGAEFVATSISPDWGDKGDPLLNGSGHEVDKEQIVYSRRVSGSIVWHPVYEDVALSEFQQDTWNGRTVNDGGKIAILQVTSARPNVVLGGSQAVAETLATSLKNAGYDVTVYFGVREGSGVEWVHAGVKYCGAFNLTEVVLGGDGNVEFFPQVRERLESCQTIFMFDRTFNVPFGPLRVVFLGATDYKFVATALLSNLWDRLVVPSDFVYRTMCKLLEHEGLSGRVKSVLLIENPIDCEIFQKDIGQDEATGYRRLQKASEVVMLFPHRSDSGKGGRACLNLLIELNRLRPARLKFVVDPSPTGKHGFYREIQDFCAEQQLDGRVEFVPWVPRRELFDLYSSVDVTLCLGERPEGFGLVCLESILCGTPVFARARGAQTTLIPEKHGCVVASEHSSEWISQIIEVLDSDVLAGQVACGKRLIMEKFSTAHFIKRIEADLL